MEQNCQANSEVQGPDLPSTTGQYWQANWEVQLCNIVRGIGRRKGAELGGELGGGTMQNWEHKGQIWPGHSEVQRFNIGR
jgi:hypothetical protein